MDLAESLGMTLAELDQRMSPEEYALWRTRAIIRNSNSRNELSGNAAMKALRSLF